MSEVPLQLMPAPSPPASAATPSALTSVSVQQVTSPLRRGHGDFAVWPTRVMMRQSPHSGGKSLFLRRLMFCGHGPLFACNPLPSEEGTP